MPNQISSEVHALVHDASQNDYHYQLVGQILELRQLISTARVVTIAFHFDPFSEVAADELIEVCKPAKEANVEVFTYSTSHLEWLENLTLQLGASQHVSKLTDIREFQNVYGDQTPPSTSALIKRLSRGC